MTSTAVPEDSKPAWEESAGLVAFWKYDQYPFWLGGHVTHTKDAPRGVVVQTREYGIGMPFYAETLVPERIGERMLAELAKLRCEHVEAFAALEKECVRQLEERLPLLARIK